MQPDASKYAPDWQLYNDEAGDAFPLAEPNDHWLVVDAASDNHDIVAIVPKTGDEDYDNAVTYRNARLISYSRKLLAALNNVLVMFEVSHEDTVGFEGDAHNKPIACQHCRTIATTKKLLKELEHCVPQPAVKRDHEEQQGREVTISLQIGNSDNKLAQHTWACYVESIKSTLSTYATAVHFQGGTASESSRQSYCWVFTTWEDTVLPLQREVAAVRQLYKQNSVAWLSGATKFI